MMLYVARRPIDPVSAHPLQVIDIDPFQIHWSLEPSRFVRRGRYRLSGTVMARNWDRIIRMPAKHRLLAQAFEARYQLGEGSCKSAMGRLEITAEEAATFQRMFEEAGKTCYSGLFNDMKENGFRIGGFASKTVDPFHVCIGESGEFLFTTGKHRLALAKAVGIEAIPARISARHIEWIRYRRAFYQRLVADRLNNLDKQRWSHPDLQDLIQRAG